MISSVHNPKLKMLNRIRQRKEENLFLVEGLREITLALASHLNLVSLFICSDVLSENSKKFIQDCLNFFHSEIFEVSQLCFEKIAVRGKSDGIVGVFEEKKISLSDLLIKDKATFIVVENLEKPGNLGAILRTADACGISALVLLGRGVDHLNPNVIRASLGAVFTVPVVVASCDEWFNFSKKRKIKNYGAVISATSQDYHNVVFGQRCALLLGSEAKGLSLEAIDRCDQHVIIPMVGQVNSLNVSVAAGILMYRIFLS